MKVRNWKQFQHYGKRKPPWIRFYRELLDDIDFVALCGDSPIGVLIRLWLLASEDRDMDGNLPDINTLLVRLHMSLPGKVKPSDVKKLEGILTSLDHWLIRDASTMLAPCKHDATSETETEAETEERQIKAPLRSAEATTDFDRFWKEYPRKRKQEDARKAWKQTASARPPIETILAAVRRAKMHDGWKKDGGQFVPYPASWLRGHCWNDDMCQPQAPSQSRAVRHCRTCGAPHDNRGHDLCYACLRAQQQQTESYAVPMPEEARALLAGLGLTRGDDDV